MFIVYRSNKNPDTNSNKSIDTEVDTEIEDKRDLGKEAIKVLEEKIEIDKIDKNKEYKKVNNIVINTTDEDLDLNFN